MDDYSEIDCLLALLVYNIIVIAIFAFLAEVFKLWWVVLFSFVFVKHLNIEFGQDDEEDKE